MPTGRARGDVPGRILDAALVSGLSRDCITIGNLAPVDRVHACRLGVHVPLGPTAPAKIRNATRAVGDGSTRPVQILCR